MHPFARRAILASALLAWVSSAARAQWPSTTLPPDNWAVPFVEHLIQSGIIPDPDPLTRPLSRSAVLRSLLSVDTAALPAEVGSTVGDLIRRLEAPMSGPTMALFPYVGLRSVSQGRRDPLRAGGQGSTAIQMGFEGWATTGPFAMSSAGILDRGLRFDPDYTGSKDRPLAFRFYDAYVSVQRRYGEIAYGSVDRNWGPAGIEGLMHSSGPYGYDHLFARIGASNLRLELLLAQLNDTLSPSGTTEHRWWFGHRLVLRPWPWIVGSLEEGILFREGPTLETWYLNPLSLSKFTREQNGLPDSAKVEWAGDLWLRLPRGMVLQLQMLINDMTLLSPHKAAPDRLGGTALIDIPLSRRASIRALGTFVSSLTYRTFSDAAVETQIIRNVGLGRNFDDYAQWTLSGGWLARPRVLISPELTLLLQGEGNILKQTPLPDPHYPFLFVGTVERTMRVGLRIQTWSWKSFDLSVQGGLNRINNVNNVPGVSTTRPTGEVVLRYHLGGEFATP